MSKGDSERARARAPRALELRIAGLSYRQIGQQLGISYQTAFRDVNTTLAELDALTKRRAERLRDLELRRLDKMTVALQEKARSGDEKAIRVLVLIMDRRAKLTGIDAPATIEATSGGQPVAFTLHLTRPDVC